jgi:glutathione S-transferase
MARPVRQGQSAAGALLLAAAGSAWCCGLEDPASVAAQRGMMNLAFPQSAHVRTAIWQAQLAGELPRDDALRRDALTPQARGALQRMRANVLLQRLAARLSAPPEAANAPSLAIVLMGPMLWSRFEALDGEVQVQVHVAGPEPGDLVLVTDTPGLEAIAAGGMDFARAAELGVLRLYGPAAQLDLLQLRLTPGIPK